MSEPLIAQTRGAYASVGNLFLIGILPNDKDTVPTVKLGYRDDEDDTWIRPLASVPYHDLATAIKELGTLMTAVNDELLND